MNKLFCLIVLLILMGPVASHAEEPETCTFGEDNMAPPNLTRFGRFTIKFLTWMHSVELNGNELANLIRSPDLMLSLRQVNEEARSAIKELCDLPVIYDPTLIYDEEADAVRHFVASSLLASLVGFNEAWLTVASHESVKKTEPDGDMDTFNNQLGLEYGATFFKGKRKTSPDSEVIKKVKARAMELLNAGAFKVLHSSSTKCGRPNVYKGLKNSHDYWTEKSAIRKSKAANSSK